MSAIEKTSVGILAGISIITIGILFLVRSLYNTDTEQALVCAILVAFGLLIIERDKVKSRSD